MGTRQGSHRHQPLHPPALSAIAGPLAGHCRTGGQELLLLAQCLSCGEENPPQPHIPKLGQAHGTGPALAHSSIVVELSEVKTSLQAGLEKGCRISLHCEGQRRHRGLQKRLGLINLTKGGGSRVGIRAAS